MSCFAYDTLLEYRINMSILSSKLLIWLCIYYIQEKLVTFLQFYVFQCYFVNFNISAIYFDIIGNNVENWYRDESEIRSKCDIFCDSKKKYLKKIICYKKTIKFYFLQWGHLSNLESQATHARLIQPSLNLDYNPGEIVWL